MKSIFVILFLVSSSFGQSWSNILASSRAIDWTHAGLPATFLDGETTPNPWTPPTRPNCTTGQAGFTVPLTPTGGDDTTMIHNAATNCATANPNGSVLQLGAGNFSLSGASAGLWLNGDQKNVTIRGAGPMSTSLVIPQANSNQYISFGGASGTSQASVSGTVNRGDTSITVTTASPPTLGKVIWLNQCDTGAGSSIASCTTVPVDNSSIFVCGDNPVCQEGSQPTSPPYNHQFEVFVVAAAPTNNGNGTYTIPISGSNGVVGQVWMQNWSTTHGATLFWQNSEISIGLGMEDLSIVGQNTNTANSTIFQIVAAYACWVKGVRFIGSANNAALYPSTVKNSLFANNYFSAHANLPSSYHSGFFLGTSTDSLILNQISAFGIAGEYRGGNVGNVTAYNYETAAYTSETVSQWAFDHIAYSSFDLWEGNQAATMTENHTHGTHNLNTYFRNLDPCNDRPFQSPNPYGFQIDIMHRFTNLVANVIDATPCAVYEVDSTSTGAAFSIANSTDSLTHQTLMRWGNVTTVTQGTDTPANSGIRFVSGEVPSSLSSPNTTWQNPVPANHNLPCSFYFTTSASTCAILTNGGTGLSWWKVCLTWTVFPTSCATTRTPVYPSAGPDVTGGPWANGHYYDNPAAVAWANLPIDPTYQNSYTITASSWSGGTETLTVSSLPNTIFLLGSFQLSGVNAACRTGATFNGNNGANDEIQITNSSATTISYALPVNPASACTGTGAFKFPDVRKFDETVFQLDTGGATPTVPSPTMLVRNTEPPSTRQ